MNKTSIEWTDYTWNPVTGCTKVSQGCKNCYAETLTKRFGKHWGVDSFREVVLHWDRLQQPYAMAIGQKLDGKKIFVCDMSDLFHEDVPFEFIDRVYQVIADLSNFKRIRSTWQILTKRPDRMLEYHQQSPFRVPPYADIWHGVSVEDQATADQRIPILIKVPGTRFLSCEPLLGPVNLREVKPERWSPEREPYCWIDALDYHPIGSPKKPFIDWVICGGESGHGARPMHPDWVRSLRNQCAAAGVPFFFKQWGEWGPNIPDGKSREAKGIHANGMFGSAFKSEGAKETFARVGKSHSGNFLDGKQHLEFPLTNPIP